MNGTAFLQHALGRPTRTGVAAPSSQRLAQAMAEQVVRASCVVELAAGTGAITTALHQRYPQMPMLVVESEPALAERLQGRWEGVEVRWGVAHEILQHEALRLPPATVLVSSLSFRSLRAPLREQTIAALCSFIEAHATRRLVQSTYLPRAPFDLPAGSVLSWQRRQRVWRHLPPADVWMLQRAG